jgi:hypothetical protein
MLTLATSEELVMSRLTSRLTATLSHLWHTDAPLTFTGLAMIVLAVFTAIGLAVDPRIVTGAPVWLKPAKFAVSIAIYAFTLAWVFSYLPAWPRMRRAVGRVTAAVLMLEFVIIAGQAARGTTSHFNVGTLLDTILFGVMGAAILVQTVTSIAVAVALWRERFGDRALGWALRLGMTITIAGAFSGGLMTTPTAAQIDAARAGERMLISGAHTVGGPDGGPGMAGTGWSREHGDIRVAHFAGLHALQVLPLFVLLLRRRGISDEVAARLAVVAGASYAAVFAVLLWQALRGQSILQPDALTLSVAAAWAALTLAAAWLAASRAAAPRPRAVMV